MKKKGNKTLIYDRLAHKNDLNRRAYNHGAKKGFRKLDVNFMLTNLADSTHENAILPVAV